MSESVKKIIGQPLLTISYKKPLEKNFVLGFANGYLEKKTLAKVHVQKKSNISNLTNNICSHGLLISPFVHPNPTIRKSNFKNRNPTDY
jgi:hypothetical protein